MIATLSSTTAAVAAKAATSAIPIYFLVADPPVELGLVSSLNRPGGNATGITTLAAKRLGLLRELVLQAKTMAVLLKPSHPSAKAVTQSLQATARTLEVPLDVLEASTDREIEDAYSTLKPGVALLVATDPFFFVRRAQLVALSARHTVPAIYDSREFAKAGGLMSYGPNHMNLWAQAGTYVGASSRARSRSDLPVAQPTIVRVVINLKAEAIGLDRAAVDAGTGRRGDRVTMKRRDFVALLAGAAAVAMPQRLRAQQPRIATIGVLVTGNASPNEYLTGLREALRDVGLIEGQNVRLEVRTAEGRAGLLPNKPPSSCG